MPVVSVSGLHKSYNGVQAVDGVDFEIEQGEAFALLGPNGAGKTTCLEILEGFRRRDRGEVQVLGVDPGVARTQRWLRERLGVVLQELAVEPYFTVRQVLTRNAGFYPSPRPVPEVIDLIGLTEKSDAKIKTLSGGQQRRLDIGLGIVGNPELLFLDEPTTGLDPAARRTTWELVDKLTSEGTTVILTTHYMDEAEKLADRVAVIARGRIVASGTPSTIGGRDVGAATVRFRLPEDVSLAELPVAVASAPAGGGMVEVRTGDELGVLHELTGWAIERRVQLVGLTVSRDTLEDVYLRLTGSSVESSDAEVGT